MKSGGERGDGGMMNGVRADRDLYVVLERRAVHRRGTKLSAIGLCNRPVQSAWCTPNSQPQSFAAARP